MSTGEIVTRNMPAKAVSVPELKDFGFFLMKKMQEDRSSNRKSFGGAFRVDTTLGFKAESPQVIELSGVLMDRICAMSEIDPKDMSVTQECEVVRSVLKTLDTHCSTFRPQQLGMHGPQLDLLYRASLLYILKELGVSMDDMNAYHAKYIPTAV